MRVGERFRSGGPRTAMGVWRATGGALKCAATSATANQRQGLPGSMNLNRPLQMQRQRRRKKLKTTEPAGRRRYQSPRRPAKAGRYRVKTLVCVKYSANRRDMGRKDILVFARIL